MAGSKRRPSAYTQAFIEEQKEATPETQVTEETPPVEETPISQEPPTRQKPVSTKKNKSVSTETQKPILTEVQKPVNTEEEGETHKQTIIIKESLSRRVKVYVATHKKETIGSVYAQALEMFLDAKGNQ